MAIYVASGLTQLAGGHMADRFPAKAVYVSMFALQVPFLAIGAVIGGPLIVPVMFAAAAANSMAVPAESALLTMYSPSKHRSLAFGAKFVISLGVAPLAIMLVAWVEQATGGFVLLFALLAAFAITLVLAALLLPAARPQDEAEQPAPVAVAAE